MEDPPTTASDGSPWRFSLAALLILTALAAVACSLLFASPGWVRFVTAIFLCVALAVIWLVALIHGRGYLRTFATGALCSAGVAALAVALMLAILCLDGLRYDWERFVGQYEDLGFWPAVLVTCCFIANVATGLLAVLVRGLIESSRRL